MFRSLRKATSRPWLLRLGLVAASALVSGCALFEPPPPTGPVTVPVVVDDTSASAGSVRLTWRTRDRESKRDGGGLELDYSRYRGAYTQPLRSWERVVIGGAFADGPQGVRHDVDLRYLHLVYTYTFSVGEDRVFKGVLTRPLEVVAFAGLGRSQFAIHSQSEAPGTPLLGRETDLGGLVVGAAPRVYFTDSLASEARFAIAYLGKREDDSSLVERNSAELALVYRPVRYVELRGGYFWMRAEMAEIQNESKVSAKLRGSFLGLALNF